MTDIDDDDLDAGNEPCPDCDATGIDDLGNVCEWCKGTGVVDT